MIYDGFMFFNEFEILELRLHEMAGIVDKFIIVESSITHSGQPKTMALRPNLARFEKFLSKITLVEVLDTPVGTVTWNREDFQRNAMMRGIPQGASPTDLLIVGDVDEIVKAETLRKILPVREPLSLKMRSYGGYLNARSGDWMHAKVTPLSALRNKTPNQIRHTAFRQVEDAGWHFSYSGGPDKIHEKMSAFSHQEPGVQKWNDLERLRRDIPQGIGVFGGPMSFETIDETFPVHLRENQDRYRHLIWIPDKA